MLQWNWSGFFSVTLYQSLRGGILLKYVWPRYGREHSWEFSGTIWAAKGQKTYLRRMPPLNDWYKVTLKNPLQFHCSIDYLAIGCSFRKSAGIYNATKDRTGMASMGCLHQRTVAKYVQIWCAINFIQLKTILSEKCWTFSVAVDMSNHLSTGYLDMRARVYLQGRIENFHVVSLPINGRHTAAVMFEALEKFFDDSLSRV